MIVPEDVGGFWDWSFKGLCVIIGTVFGWTINNMKQDIKENEFKIEQQAKEVAQHQLYTEKNFVNQTTISRLYDVIERMADDINAIKVAIGPRKSH